MTGRLLAALMVGLLLEAPATAAELEQVYLGEREAPQAVFPDAGRFKRIRVPSDEALRARITAQSGRTPPTVFEPAYTVFLAYKESALLGRAVVVEERGKHRNITLIVGVDESGAVTGVAVMVYREAYGGEVRSQRFLAQYKGKRGDEPLLPGRDVRNITGATLSVNAVGRAVKKAVAVAGALRDGAAGPGGAARDRPAGSTGVPRETSGAD